MINWIEERTGFVSMTKNFLTEDVPGGASYWYVFGSATLFAMILQITTGIFLTFWYAPSADTAWESTRLMYLNPFEHFVLSMHYWGATAMIALVFLHLLQVAIFGAYKSPRELQWIVGVLLLLVTLALGLTGYLLPWDMDAYFASQVSLNIAGGAPIAGPFLQNVAQGGATMGTATINRFFGLHVWLLPALLVLLAGAHLAIFRHNGPAGPVDEDRRRLKPAGRFWPDQLFMDTVVSFLVFLAILFFAWKAPPFLDQKANPLISFQPYPAWYFLALFGLLGMVPPDLDKVATIYIPTLFLIVLIVLPWLDRSFTRSFGSRRIVLTCITVGVIVIVWLSIQSQMKIVSQQALNPHLSEAQVLAGTSTGTTTGAAASATTTTTAAAAPLSAAAKKGQTIFSQNCSTCHGAQGQGTPGVFPPLANNPVVTGDPATVIGIVKNGKTGPISVNGQSYNGTMPSWKSQLSTSDIANVITFIRTGLGQNKASPVTPAQVRGSK
jgi:ubiquinol-cytochrome c reductase cytochrome b subunit